MGFFAGQNTNNYNVNIPKISTLPKASQIPATPKTGLISSLGGFADDVLRMGIKGVQMVMPKSAELKVTSELGKKLIKDIKDLPVNRQKAILKSLKQNGKNSPKKANPFIEKNKFLTKKLEKKSMIVEEGGKYEVLSEDGKKRLGGPYDTKAEAAKRLGQIHWFKNHPGVK